MRKLIFAVAVIMTCLVSPVFSADAATAAADIKAGIAKQEAVSRDGADTFWTGLIVGGVSAAILIPVSMVVGTETGEKRTMFGIVGGAMGGVTAVLLAWGGIQWLLAEGSINDLKKSEKNISFSPYMKAIKSGDVETGLAVNIGL